MSKDEWIILAKELQAEANRAYPYYKEASEVFQGLQRIAERLGKKSESELMAEAADYGNSLR